jgi:hypothetical protein
MMVAPRSSHSSLRAWRATRLSRARGRPHASSAGDRGARRLALARQVLHPRGMPARGPGTQQLRLPAPHSAALAPCTTRHDPRSRRRCSPEEAQQVELVSRRQRVAGGGRAGAVFLDAWPPSAAGAADGSRPGRGQRFSHLDALPCRRTRASPRQPFAARSPPSRRHRDDGRSRSTPRSRRPLSPISQPSVAVSVAVLVEWGLPPAPVAPASSTPARPAPPPRPGATHPTHGACPAPPLSLLAR